VDAEFGGDLAAVDDEGFVELVLHFQQFAQGAVGQCGEPEQEWVDLA
jgi:hypothetical protein